MVWVRLIFMFVGGTDFKKLLNCNEFLFFQCVSSWFIKKQIIELHCFAHWSCFYKIALRGGLKFYFREITCLPFFLSFVLVWNFVLLTFLPVLEVENFMAESWSNFGRKRCSSAKRSQFDRFIADSCPSKKSTLIKFVFSKFLLVNFLNYINIFSKIMVVKHLSRLYIFLYLL